MQFGLNSQESGTKNYFHKNYGKPYVLKHDHIYGRDNLFSYDILHHCRLNYKHSNFSQTVYPET